MNKGFTLAELMGVIVILAVLAVIVTTTIDRNITNSRFSTCQTQEKNIIEAAKIFVTNDPSRLPSVTNNPSSITVSELINAGDLDSDMENPMTGKLYSESGDDIYVEISASIADDGSISSGYTYTVKYNNKEDSCQN